MKHSEGHMNSTSIDGVTMGKARSVDFLYLHEGSAHNFDTELAAASKFSLQSAKTKATTTTSNKAIRRIEPTKEGKNLRPRSQRCNVDSESSSVSTSRPLCCKEAMNMNCFPNDDNAHNSNDVVVRLSFPTVSFAKLSVFVLAILTVSNRRFSMVSQRYVCTRSSVESIDVVSDAQTIPPLTGLIDSCQEHDSTTSESWVQLLQIALFGVPIINSPFNVTEDVYMNCNSRTPSLELVQRSHIMSLSTVSPFVPVKDIADLTLDDVGQIIRYSMISGIRDFDISLFVQGVRPQMRKVLDLFNNAITQSRGIENGECKVRSMSDVSIGQIDVLKFSAALRIFAEWRILRQVPDGYKGYAFGMNLGYKDVVQNLVKIEQSVHSWIYHHTRGNNTTICGPTLRQLLEHEGLSGVHTNLPRLNEKSGAMGVLWVYRQLQYQSRIFSNFLQVPDKFANTVEGVKAAYKEVYDRYHGWAIQQIFTYSFQAAPKSDEIFKHMNPRKLVDLRMSSCRLQHNPKNLLENNPFETLLMNLEATWNDFALNMLKGFDDLVTNIVKIVNKEHTSTFEISKDFTGSTQETGCNEETIMEGLVDTAREQIGTFLDDVTPMLELLSNVLKDMNMDDPTKI